SRPRRADAPAVTGRRRYDDPISTQHKSLRKVRTQSVLGLYARNNNNRERISRIWVRGPSRSRRPSPRRAAYAFYLYRHLQTTHLLFTDLAASTGRALSSTLSADCSVCRADAP